MRIPASWYVAQLKMLGAQLLTLLPVLLACRRGAFIPKAQRSIKTMWPEPYTALNGRLVDKWSWNWLNAWCNNPEDGVSGQDALVWKNGQLVSYAEYTGLSGWRLAWSWNWRNAVQALKYRYAIPGEGPLNTFTVFGSTFAYGYKGINGLNCPVGPSRV